MKQFKPLLASPVEFKHLDYDNLVASVKLDGIRAIIIDGVVMSRKLKPIPNEFVQWKFGGRAELEGYDGELIVGEPNAKDVYHRTYSGVMSEEGEPEVQFFAFDHIAEPMKEYRERHAMISEGYDDVVKVRQHLIFNEQALLDAEGWMLGQGYEGVMLRTFKGPKSVYKFGRSTAKECTLLKLKRFVDSEAEIIGFDEEMQNLNEAKKDELGNTKRSSHAENKVGKGRLGAFRCRTSEGQEFTVGTGLTHKQREEYWGQRDKLLGQFLKYKSFKIGEKDAPRFPGFLEIVGPRSPIDL